MSILDEQQVGRLYDRSARYYDGLLFLFGLAGVGRWRSGLIDSMQLVEGETVLDLCCGTGENFSRLGRAVGHRGRIIGVDLSGKMLEKALTKADKLGMKNVDLVQKSVSDYTIPADVSAVVSTFGLEMVPNYPDVISRLSAGLEPRGRLGLLGLRHPEGWPEWLIELGVKLNRPFGVSRDYEDFRPWIAAQSCFSNVTLDQHLWGAAYSCVAENAGSGQ